MNKLNYKELASSVSDRHLIAHIRLPIRHPVNGLVMGYTAPVLLHPNVGSEVTSMDGRKYRVSDTGSLVRT